MRNRSESFDFYRTALAICVLWADDIISLSSPQFHCLFQPEHVCVCVILIYDNDGKLNAWFTPFMHDISWRYLRNPYIAKLPPHNAHNNHHTAFPISIHAHLFDFSFERFIIFRYVFTSYMTMSWQRFFFGYIRFNNKNTHTHMYIYTLPMENTSTYICMYVCMTVCIDK